MNNLRITGLLAVLTGVFIAAGYFLGGTGGMVLAFGLALVINFGSYWFSHRIVVRMYGAEEVSEQDAPQLHSAVEELAENAALPKPKVYRSSMKVPNAFATGRSPKKGVVCVTDGLLSQLDEQEMKGVIAHELAHIQNRDMLVNSVVATIAGAISMLAELAFWGAMFSQEDDMGEFAGALVMMVLTPIVAVLIRTAISRRMEFRADSDAVKIHGEKEGLKSALRKISSANESSRMKGNRVQEAGANLFISNPFSGHKITRFFSTHPPLEKRLKNIDGSVTG